MIAHWCIQALSSLLALCGICNGSFASPAPLAGLARKACLAAGQSKLQATQAGVALYFSCLLRQKFFKKVLFYSLFRFLSFPLFPPATP